MSKKTITEWYDPIRGKWIPGPMPKNHPPNARERTRTVTTGDGSGTSSTSNRSGGNTGSGGGSTGKSAEEQKRDAQWKVYLSLFSGKQPPKGYGRDNKEVSEMIAKAASGEWDQNQLYNYVRTHIQKAWDASYIAADRASEAKNKLNQYFDDLSDTEREQLNKLIGKYARSHWKMTDFDTFLRDTVMSSSLFRTKYAGFYGEDGKTGGFAGAHSGYTLQEQLILYQRLKDELVSYYKSSLRKDVTAELDPTVLARALAEGWDTDMLATWYQQSDPAYYQGGEAKSKGELFEEYWNMVFGDDVPVNEEIKKAWQKGAIASFDDLVDDYLEEMPEFQELYPSYQGWRKSQVLSAGEDAPVDALSYFTTRKQLRDQYLELVGDADAEVNWELIEEALSKGWSSELFKAEFKQRDPAYRNSAEYTSKSDEFKDYWKSIFGSNAEPDQVMLDEYAKGNHTSPTDLFDRIKETSQFKMEYGSWDEFAAAQDAAGNTSAILNNPALYKEYRQAFRDAFAEMGLAVPDGWETQFFSSGMTGQEVQQNAMTYLQTNMSQQWMTGEQTDMGTALGIKNKTAGGDLRQRMNKALAKHRAFSSSEYVAPRQAETEGSNLITQRI